MKRGSKKSPIQHVPKTKEQLIREAEIKRKRKIVVDSLFPALKEATISIDEAKMLLSAAGSLIMEEVLATMKERRFSEIYDRVVRKLAPNDERLLQIEKLFETIQHENLFVARELIEGMNRAIEQMIHEDMQSRTLDTLNPKWDIYLN